MALQGDFVTQDQSYVGINLSRFQETCKTATQDTPFCTRNDTPQGEKYRHSYEEADEMAEQLSINLMKETWNIPLDE